MLLNIEKSGELDKERSNEWLVNTGPGFLTPVLTQLSFQSHRQVFSHASAEVRGENTPERNFASTWSRTHNHQVMSPIRSPLRHPSDAQPILNILLHAIHETAVINE